MIVIFLDGFIFMHHMNLKNIIAITLTVYSCVVSDMKYLLCIRIIQILLYIATATNTAHVFNLTKDDVAAS